MWLLLLLATVYSSSALAADELSPEVLKQRLDRGDDILILDLRSRELAAQATLPGALLVGSDPKGYLADNRGGEVILIAASTLSYDLRRQWEDLLRDAGFKVHWLAGGVADWIRAGGATEERSGGYRKPGSLPFLIPRGLCEANEPAHVFE